MATINVRRLDEEVVRHLKRRAAENNRSLESEVRHILQCASEDNVSAKRKSKNWLRDCGRGPRGAYRRPQIRRIRPRVLSGTIETADTGADAPGGGCQCCHQKARLGEIGYGEAGTLAAAIAEMPLHWYDDEVLGADAARLAFALDRPVYDRARTCPSNRRASGDSGCACSDRARGIGGAVGRFCVGVTCRTALEPFRSLI